MRKLINKIPERINLEYGRFSIIKDGFWFVDVPRTSSSSIRSELGKKFGRAHGKSFLDKKHATEECFPDHIPAVQMRKFLGNRVWKRIFTFTVVRNPWDRIFSMFHYRKNSGHLPEKWEFGDYVRAMNNNNDTKLFSYHAFRYGAADYVTDENGKIIVDYIAKYESRSADLDKIAMRLGIENFGKLCILKCVPDGEHYSTHYDNETREIISNLYKKDIELFDYRF